MATPDIYQEARRLSDKVWEGLEAKQDLLRLFDQASKLGISPQQLAPHTVYTGEQERLIGVEPGKFVFYPTAVYREMKKLRDLEKTHAEATGAAV